MMRLFPAIYVFCVIVLFSCAPVLNRSSMQEGERKVSFNALRNSPGEFKGKSFVFGGVIVRARLTQEGSELEVLHVPVDRYGYFEERGRSEGRFLAVMHSNQGMLDPEVYKKGRRITLAAQFQEVRKGRIDEIEYAYPVFLIRDIHLWSRERRYAPVYYYDPWFYPFPYYYRDPWWSYPYYYNYYSYPGGPPRTYRRQRPPEGQQPPQTPAPALPRRFEPASPEKLPDSGARPERRPDRR